MRYFSANRSLWFQLWSGLGALCLLLLSTAGFSQTRYVWHPISSSASWADANNWAPTRTTPATTDVLVFDGAVTPTTSVNLDFTSTQTVGQLIFTGNVQLLLSTDAIRTLTLATVPPAIGLQIEAGSKAQVIGTQGSNSALAVQLATNVKATIAGRLEFLGTATIATSSPHTLISGTAGAIEFASGSYFLSGAKFSGYPFGEAKTSMGAVVFHSGATFEQASGGSAFGGKTWSVAVFEPGSTFLFTTSGTVGVSNRTFGYLTINANRAAPTASFSSGTLVIRNDLTIVSGTHPFNIRKIELQGNIVLNGGNMTLTSVDTGTGALQSSVLTFNGSTPQTIVGTGKIDTGPNISMWLNNAAGLTLQRPLQINDTLKLTQGMLTATAANNLTLGSTATISGGNAASFVDGPLSRLLASTTATDLVFPLGSGGVYRSLTLRAQQTDATETRYTAQQFNQAPTVRDLPTAANSLQRVSKVRYFTVTNNGAANFGQGTITLNYNTDDQVDAPEKLRIAKSGSATNWLDLGGTGTGAVVGSITSTVPFTSFSDFVLASTEATGGAGNNPLPVSLTSFTAQRQATGVLLQWTTASELNNNHFAVQRSADGQVFEPLATIPGQGTSTVPSAYSFTDKAKLGPEVRYYRLSQVDKDGAVAYSPVVVVQPELGVTTIFPNPAQQQLNFQLATSRSYRVLNTLGQPVLTGQAAIGLNSVSLAGLAPGAYYLELLGEQSKQVHHFLKLDAGQ